MGPSEPACRSRLQTASESWRSRVAVGSVRGKGAHDVSGVGHGDERIECYVYPSIGEKQRVTGNAAVAHGVTWANAVHVARDGTSGGDMAREMAYVAGARALGKVYNPLIRNGLAIYGAEDPSGPSSVEAARRLQATGELPRLEALVEPPDYDRIDARVSGQAAGAFAAFLVRELGLPGYRAFYSGMARTRAPAREVLERTLGEPLEDIEARWIRFILDGSGGVPSAESR